MHTRSSYIENVKLQFILPRYKSLKLCLVGEKNAMNTLPVEIVREIGLFVIETDVDKYCMLNDTSRGLRLTCTFLHKALKPLVIPQQRCCTFQNTCESVADMSCPGGRDPNDPFDRPLYSCAPYLYVKDWYKSASTRCVCKIKHPFRLNFNPNYPFARYFWRADDSVATYDSETISRMKQKCQDLIQQIQENRTKDGHLLAASCFEDLSEFFTFQECMKRWGFASDKIRCCARRMQPRSDGIIIYWQKHHEEICTNIQLVEN